MSVHVAGGHFEMMVVAIVDKKENDRKDHLVISRGPEENMFVNVVGGR
jgi:hypothetical protein